MIQLINVKKKYILGQTQISALRGVSLEVSPGQSWALLGQSGSGKSTLLHIAGLIDDADEGEVRFQGQSISTLRDRYKSQFRLESFGFIFQNYHLIPVLNVMENTMLPGRLAKRSISKVKDKAKELLERVGLYDVRHRPIHALSGGQRQRVAIARALVNSPKLVLADEPTANLDSTNGAKVMELICELCAAGNCSLVMATHDLKIANKMSHQVVLKDGLVENREGV